MELICIPYYDCCSNYLCTELGGSGAVHTYLQLLDDTDRNSWRCADEPKCNGQFLIMVTHMKHFLEMLLSSQNPLCFQNNIIHKRKEALDISGPNGRGRKSKLQGSCMAPFSVVTVNSLQI
jgi:hypothetical protein